MGEIAGKAVAAVKGQVGTARAAVTSQAETHLRNAQEELREEHVEIAIYRRIETFATEVGDRETAQLAKRIIRDEERMAKFLDAELDAARQGGRPQRRAQGPARHRPAILEPELEPLEQQPQPEFVELAQQRVPEP